MAFIDNVHFSAPHLSSFFLVYFEGKYTSDGSAQ